MNTIRHIITELSGRRNKECYYVLCCAVEIAYFYAPEEPLMKVILTDVSKKLGKSNTKSVSKALSRAVEDIWDYGDREKLRQIYSREVLDRPTPKELVYRIAEYAKGCVEYHVYPDTATGEFGIYGHEGSTGNYAAVYPCSESFEKMERLARYLNQTRTPLSAFSERFLESGVIRPMQYSEYAPAFGMKTEQIHKTLKELLDELECSWYR